MIDRLTPLQHEILDAFFAREERFFLTGGAALAGFHLGHRATQDLDLFTAADVLDDGEAVLAEAARALGAEVSSLRTAPDFRRRLVRRGSESVLVDLVRDRTPQIHEEKLWRGRIRVDLPEEILANKLCTLLSRAEIRDLVDVLTLERSGLSVERALEAAARKDTGLTPGQLAWVLSQIEIGDDAGVPGDVAVEEVRSFLCELQRRLARMAFPDGGSRSPNL